MNQESGIIPLELMEKMYAGKLGWLLTVFHELRKLSICVQYLHLKIVAEVIVF